MFNQSLPDVHNDLERHSFQNRVVYRALHLQNGAEARGSAVPNGPFVVEEIMPQRIAKLLEGPVGSAFKEVIARVVKRVFNDREGITSVELFLLFSRLLHGLAFCFRQFLFPRFSLPLLFGFHLANHIRTFLL